jgi:hypothetical protein
MSEAWILKVLVGSRAHGLHTAQSDYDYRGVFVQPTREILGLAGTTRQTHWVEGRDADQAGAKVDDTAWEIGHFLKLTLQCNPTILEVFRAPIVEATDEGRELQALFPLVWHPARVRDAFVGYGLNQRKKLLEGKEVRPAKYATAYLRTLLQAEQLLRNGTLPVNMEHHEEYQTLLMFKNGLATSGAVIDKCRVWEKRVEALAVNHPHIQDVAALDAFLLTVRQAHWTA